MDALLRQAKVQAVLQKAAAAAEEAMLKPKREILMVVLNRVKNNFRADATGGNNKKSPFMAFTKTLQL
jgi:hypothetical protein